MNVYTLKGYLLKYFLMTLITSFVLITLSSCGGSSSSSSDDGSGDGDLSLGGSLFFKQGMTVDGDTVEPNNTVIDNNGADTSKTQPIDYPSTVSGFLGTIGDQSDFFDFYKTSMLAGQVVTLVIADPNAQDFDLILYDEAQQKVDDSVGTGNLEQITIPSDGVYYIAVYGYSVENLGDDGGLYTLTTGEANSLSSSHAYQKTHLSSSDAMMEDEVLFKSRPSLAKSSSARVALSSRLKRDDVLSLREGAAGIVRMRLQRPAALKTTQIVQTRKAFQTDIPDVIKKVKALRRDKDIDFAQPNYIIQTFKVPNDTYYPLQWHYPQIDLPLAWELTTGSADVIVAVIDTGVVLAHPDIRNQLVPGYDFISDTTNAADGNGIDSDPNDPGDGAHAGESSFHGTHVAGTIAAQSNNSFGVAGVAWDAKIMPIRALGVQGGSDYDIGQSIRYAAGLSNDSGTLPAKKADIINMSLGGSGFSQVMQDAILAARAAGVIVVAAAGNENADANNVSPAGLTGVVTVSAVGYTAQKAPYSNFGTSVDVAAPGGNTGQDANGDGNPDGVLSTLATDDDQFVYQFYQGTSMAAPHIAGVAALMKSAYPALTPNDFDLLLAGTHPSSTRAITTDIGVSGKDDLYGHGLINALNAVEAARTLAGNPQATEPLLALQPESLTFNTAISHAEMTLYNIGGGTLDVSSISATEPWVSINERTAGSLTYDVTVDQSGLATGVYQAAIEIASNGGDKTVSVVLSITDAAVTQGDIGTVHVLLLDPTSFDTIVSTKTSSFQNYTFTLTGVPAGEYYLAAGTDLNGDDFISDDGEDFGIYPILSSISIIDIQNNIDGFKFNVEPLIALPSTSSTSTTTSARTIQIRKTP